jgi:phosphoribosylformylglycinamidine cyclo-ligase
VEANEMYRTFNCGVGMVICVAQADVEPTLALLAEQGESAAVIGSIQPADGGEPVIVR